jgi:hypothetical protein
MLEWTPTIAAAAASRLDTTVIRAKVHSFAEQLDTRHAAIGGANVILAQTAALLVALGDAPPLSPARLAAIGSVPVAGDAGPLQRAQRGLVGAQSRGDRHGANHRHGVGEFVQHPDG